MTEVIQIVLALGPLPLIWLLARSKGILWRLAELPEAVTSSAWASQGLSSSIDRILIRAVLVFAYLCGTVSEANDAVRERLRPLLLDPQTHAQGRAETLELLRARAVRASAITFWALLVSMLDWFAGSLMIFTHTNGAALGHLATPYVMALAAISTTRLDGSSLTMADDGGTLGPFLIAVRLVLVGATVGLAVGDGWSDGALIAHIVGSVGLVAAAVGAAAPVRRWLRADRYEGWRQHWLGRWTVIGAGLCGVATVLELITHSSTMSSLFVAASLLGSAAFFGAASVIALLGTNPPGPGLVAKGAGPGDDAPTMG